VKLNNYVVELSEVETMAFDWGSFKVTCSPELNNSNRFSGGVVEMKPGMGHDRHNHPGAEEIIFVLSGEGEQMIEDENGQPIKYTVTPGSTIYVPEGRYHSTVNIGGETMRVFVLYSPAGSENGLRLLPDYKLIPAGETSKN
jgi:oxalate decarboxylase/phosphoglucose isomerase-like protein (cupin superfamily)